MRAHRQKQYTTGNGFHAPLAVRHVYKMQLSRDRNFGILGLLKKSSGGGQNRGRVGVQHIIHLRSQPIRSVPKARTVLLVIRVAGVLVLRNSRRSWLVEATLVREYVGKCKKNAVVNVPSRWPPYVPDRTYRCPWRRQWCCRSASRRRVLHRRRNNPATWPRAALYSGRVRRN